MLTPALGLVVVSLFVLELIFRWINPLWMDKSTPGSESAEITAQDPAEREGFQIWLYWHRCTTLQSHAGSEHLVIYSAGGWNQILPARPQTDPVMLVTGSWQIKLYVPCCEKWRACTCAHAGPRKDSMFRWKFQFLYQIGPIIVWKQNSFATRDIELKGPQLDLRTTSFVLQTQGELELEPRNTCHTWQINKKPNLIWKNI